MFDESLWCKPSRAACYIDDVWIGPVARQPQHEQLHDSWIDGDAQRLATTADVIVALCFQMGCQRGNNKTIAFFRDSWGFFASH
jgi:hypothetical protein